MGNGVDGSRPRPTSSARWFMGVGTLVVVALGGMAWATIDVGGESLGSQAETGSEAEVSEPARVGNETRSTPTEVALTPLEAKDSKAPTVQPEAEPQVTSADVPAMDELAVEEQPATEVESHKPRRAKKPVEPPPDAELKKMLSRKIKVKCSAELASGSVTVVFDVMPNGEIKHLTTMSKGAAGGCAKRQFAGTRFRARASETIVEIEVNRAS